VKISADNGLHSLRDYDIQACVCFDFPPKFLTAKLALSVDYSARERHVRDVRAVYRDVTRSNYMSEAFRDDCARSSIRMQVEENRNLRFAPGILSLFVLRGFKRLEII